MLDPIELVNKIKIDLCYTKESLDINIWITGIAILGKIIMRLEGDFTSVPGSSVELWWNK